MNEICWLILVIGKFNEWNLLIDLFAVGVNSPMVADTIELGISLLRGGNVEVQKVNGLQAH